MPVANTSDHFLDYQRLLKKQPVNKKEHGLTLNDIIQEFRSLKPSPIPDHLVHVAASVHLIGNVPGAHATEIPNYHFSRGDAEFTVYGTSHFLDQYFSKIDQEATQYYAVTIDLEGRP